MPLLIYLGKCQHVGTIVLLSKCEFRGKFPPHISDCFYTKTRIIRDFYFSPLMYIPVNGDFTWVEMRWSPYFPYVHYSYIVLTIILTRSAHAHVVSKIITPSQSYSCRESKFQPFPTLFTSQKPQILSFHGRNTVKT